MSLTTRLVSIGGMLDAYGDATRIGLAAHAASGSAPAVPAEILRNSRLFTRLMLDLLARTGKTSACKQAIEGETGMS
jgi:hypothetical protein